MAVFVNDVGTHQSPTIIPAGDTLVVIPRSDSDEGSRLRCS